MTRDADVPRARKLRQAANANEDRAWQVLRQFRKLGYPVRRQHKLDGLHVDFAITKVRLAIEIDGTVHHEPHVKARDADKDQRLAALGWSVLHFPVTDQLDEDGLFAAVAERLGL